MLVGMGTKFQWETGDSSSSGSQTGPDHKPGTYEHSGEVEAVWRTVAPIVAAEPKRFAARRPRPSAR